MVISVCSCVLGHDAVVLGAWGAGAFGGDPEVVARAFADVLARVVPRFMIRVSLSFMYALTN